MDKRGVGLVSISIILGKLLYQIGDNKKIEMNEPKLYVPIGIKARKKIVIRKC